MVLGNLALFQKIRSLKISATTEARRNWILSINGLETGELLPKFSNWLPVFPVFFQSMTWSPVLSYFFAAQNFQIRLPSGQFSNFIRTKLLSQFSVKLLTKLFVSSTRWMHFRVSVADCASSLVSILSYFRRRGFNSSNGKSLQVAEIQNFPGLGGPQSAKASAQQL